MGVATVEGGVEGKGVAAIDLLILLWVGEDLAKEVRVNALEEDDELDNALKVHCLADLERGAPAAARSVLHLIF